MEYPKDESELRRWIADGVEESLSLDYKGPASLSDSEKEKKEITKDVTAMANSAGGVLIYGVREFPAKSGQKHKPEKIEAVDSQRFTKEWLEQVINSRISPRILGLKIIPIRLVGDPTGVVYVVEIPQSEVGHQADDKRYYRRFNFESVPMEDYEIRDLMGRMKHPRVELVLRITEEPPGDILRPSAGEKVQFLNVSFENVGRKVAHHVEAFLYLPLMIMGLRDRADYTVEKHRGGTEVACFRLSLDHVDSADPTLMATRSVGPLLPGLKVLLKKIRLQPRGQNPDTVKIGWRLFADDAPSQVEKIEFNKYFAISEFGEALSLLLERDLDLGSD